MSKNKEEIEKLLKAIENLGVKIEDLPRLQRERESSPEFRRGRKELDELKEKLGYFRFEYSGDEPSIDDYEASKPQRDYASLTEIATKVYRISPNPDIVRLRDKAKKGIESMVFWYKPIREGEIEEEKRLRELNNYQGGEIKMEKYLRNIWGIACDTSRNYKRHFSDSSKKFQTAMLGLTDILEKTLEED